MDLKGQNPGNKVYVDFEPSMEWAWEDKWGTLILYLPGFNKQQLRVQVSASGMLKLSGERPIGGGERWNRFYKEVQIPKNCNSNAITAKFENNILYVQLPKNMTSTTATATATDTATTPPTPANSDQQPKPQSLVQTDPPPPLKEPSKPTPPPTPTTRDEHEHEPLDKNKGDDQLGKDGKHKSGEQNNAAADHSREEPAPKLDQEAPPLAYGSSNSTLENYTKVVGGLARDLRKGGKLFNFAVTLLVALILGLYFGNIIKSSKNPEI